MAGFDRCYSLLTQEYRALQKSSLPEFSIYNPGELFRKSMLLDRDFLNSAPGLYMENSNIISDKEIMFSVVLVCMSVCLLATLLKKLL